MSSKEMWKHFKTYVDNFSRVSFMPYKIVVERRQVVLLPFSKPKRTLSLITILVLLSFVPYFLLKAWEEFVKFSLDEMSFFKIWTYIVCSLIILTFISLNGMILCTPQILLHISNPIQHFRFSIKGIVERAPLDDIHYIIHLCTKGLFFIIFKALPFQLIGMVMLNMDPLLILPITNKLTALSQEYLGLFLGSGLSKITRAIALFFIITELLKSVGGFFVFSLLVVCSVNNLVRSLNIMITVPLASSRELRFYRELELWFNYANKTFCEIAVPPLVFFGVLFVIFALYGTIALSGKVAVILHLFVGSTSFMSFLFVLLVLPQGASVYENSRVYLDKLGKRGRDKYSRRLIRSMRPLKVSIGTFGKVDTELELTIFQNIIDKVVTLLLTF